MTDTPMDISQAGREAGAFARAMAWLRIHPNLIRIVSVAVFFVWWEYAGRGMSSGSGERPCRTGSRR